MRRLSAAFLATTLFAASLTVAPPAAKAQDSPAPDPRILCPWMVSEGHFRNHGDCMNGFRMGGQAMCMRMDKSMLDYLGYRNKGECVARMRELERR